MQLQAKEHEGLPVTQELRKGMEKIVPTTFKKSWPW